MRTSILAALVAATVAPPVAAETVSGAGLTVGTAELAAGRLVIRGTTRTPGVQVRIAGTVFRARSAADRRFLFKVDHRPDNCRVSLTTSEGTLPLLLGNCGPKGGKGDRGPKGPTGATGPAGEAGPEGETGPQGPIGETGPAGPQGAAGDTGPKGDAGPKGDTGPEGPAGPKGEQGRDGDVGPKGAQGPAGIAGPAGPQGPQGPRGLQGVAGPTGSFQGTIFAINVDGASGALIGESFPSGGQPRRTGAGVYRVDFNRSFFSCFVTATILDNVGVSTIKAFPIQSEIQVVIASQQSDNDFVNTDRDFTVMAMCR